ncbi:MAG: alpha/beta fold hydrolase [Bacteroidetes bacterium]|nr:alpha/beta fold hydrolase [Bacteroidota bacterium]
MQHLLLLHGAIGAKDQLQTLAENLKELSTVHTLSFSGHGGEPMPETFSIEQFSTDVLKYLQQNKIEKVNIFGYSMGGYVGLYLAKHYPEKINKVFTLATKFLWTPEIAQREIKMLDAARIKEKIPAFAQQLEKRHLPNDWKTVLHKTAEMMIKMGNKNPLTLNDLESIEKSVLIGIGDKDTMVTLEETINVYRKLKNSNLIVLPNTQHPIEKVNIKRLTEEVALFFNTNTN